jgi:hypothetical protein
VWEPEGVSERDDVATVQRRAASFGRPPSDHRPATAVLRRFIHRYGWRAYALPVLAVVTVVALMTTENGSPRATPRAASTGSATRPGVAAPPTASGSIALKSDAPGANSLNTAIPAAALPTGPAYTLQGTGTYRVLPGTGPVVGTGTVHRYDIETENGITDVNLTQFASMVQATLSDPRSWAGHAGVALQRVDSGPVDFHVTLVSSYTVRGLCGYTIPVETSCFAAAGAVAGNTVNRVVINDSRWVRGDAAYVGDLNSYRTYMINHEDGHALGHIHAHQCLPGGLAPVMMQQTFGLKSTTGQLCEANPWPYPPGAAGAPGSEQPDTPQNSEYGLQNS